MFACVYRSPTDSSNSAGNNSNINKLIVNLAKDGKYSHLCIVGDFNYNKINWSNWSSPCSPDSKEELFLEALRDSFLYQHVLEPTRCRGTDEPSTIDLIITNEEAQVSDLKYHPPLGKSDHSTLCFNFNCYYNCVPSVKDFDYHKADFMSMKRNLEVSSWLPNFIQHSNTLTTEECWMEFRDKMDELRNCYVPSKSKGAEFWRSKGKVPINSELRRLIKLKKKLHRKWLKSTGKEDEMTARVKHVEIRNEVNKQMSYTKKCYEQSICNQSIENPKRFWRHVRSSLKTKSGIAPLLSSPKDESSIKFEDKDKANILQKQFCSVFTKEPDGELPDFTPRTNKNVDIVLTVELVRKEIASLNCSKSVGPDQLHPRMLKELIEYITLPIFIIMSKSLEENYVPEDWKLANVSPIYKNKGPKNLAENYRPISLTSIVCRMVEKIVKHQIMEHLIREDLLSKRQHGFINKRSTVTQLLCFLDACT